MKKLHDSWIHRDRRLESSTDATQMVEHDGRRIMFTYTSGNSYERFKVEVFDGDKFNPVASISDLGVVTNGQSYLQSESEAKVRFEMLLRLGKVFIRSLIPVRHFN